MVARKGQNTESQIKQEDKWKIFTIILTNKKTNGSNNHVGEYKMSWEENVHSCIDRNELILGNLMCVEW